MSCPRQDGGVDGPMIVAAFGLAHVLQASVPVQAIYNEASMRTGLGLYGAASLIVLAVLGTKERPLHQLLLGAAIALGIAGCLSAIDLYLAPRLAWAPMLPASIASLSHQLAPVWFAVSLAVVVAGWLGGNKVPAPRTQPTTRSHAVQPAPRRHDPQPRPQRGELTRHVREVVVVKVRCPFCGALVDQGVVSCENCKGVV